MNNRKIKNLENDIEHLKKNVLRIENLIKKGMKELNVDIQEKDLKTNFNWSYTEKFADIQYSFMQLENLKGQLAALEDLKR